MKKSELRQIIKEEISKILKTESKKQDIQSVKGDELEKYQKKYPGLSDNYIEDAKNWFENNKSKYKTRDDMYSAYMKRKGLSRLRGTIQYEIHLVAGRYF
jgi:hypothetical protein